MKNVLVRLLALTGLATAAAVASTPARLNIVYIMADDLGRQAVSCYGSRLMPTPQIDRLARDGTRFTESFASNSICSPSRAVLITGKYNHVCGVRELGMHFDGAQPTFPKLLQRAGYQTALVGKWHLFTQPTGFDFFSVLPGQGQYLDCPFKDSTRPWGDNGNRGGLVHQGYVTDVITDIALDWLERRDPSKPFCLQIHHKAPHSPHIPAPRHADLFKGKVWPEPANLLDAYGGRAPEKVADEISWSRLPQQPEPQYAPVRQKFSGDRERDTRLIYQEYVGNYLRLVAALDENVGRVLDYLDRSGLTENTVVILTSDNGFFLGEHGFYNKMWMYEESLHLPLIVRLPKAVGGKRTAVSHDLVGMIDIAPTILDLAGAGVPADIQGRSIKPLLLGQPVDWRSAFYYHYYGAAGQSPVGNWIARHEIFGVRTKSEKLVCYPNWKGGAFWEFFDLRQDPQEMNNRIAAPDAKQRVIDARVVLRRLAEHYQDKEAVAFLDLTDGSGR